MAKIATDIEQSKQLSKILPIDSADMFYGTIAPYDYSDRMYDGGVEDMPLPKRVKESSVLAADEYDGEIPAWSLASLMDMLPDIIRKSERMCDWYWFNLNKNPYQISYGNSLGLSGEWHDMISSPQRDNLIDACVEMIVKLNEKGLL